MIDFRKRNRRTYIHVSSKIERERISRESYRQADKQTDRQRNTKRR